MSDLRTAAQQALDYWEQVAWGDAVMADKMDALRAALAQQDERKPLTEEQISALLMQAAEQRLGALAFARAIERAHGIGGQE